MREILTGARRRIEESLGKDWGPFVLVQDLAAEKFELDHFQPYANGDMGRVHIKIGPDLGFGGRVSGFVHTKDMNFIRDNVGLTECTFNREPVQVSVPVISTINVSGTWRGTGRWASTWRGTGRLASSESFQIVMSLSQSDKAVSGRVSIHNRPAPLADYDADIIGKADEYLWMKWIRISHVDTARRRCCWAAANARKSFARTSCRTAGGIVIISIPSRPK